MSDPVFKILADFGETDRSNVWTVQNATVIKHACLERVAAKAGVCFDVPQILRSERDEAVILVSGVLGKRSEWSIGEALVNVNYRVTGKMAAYVYAMAEKRAKDRVILKLIGLHGLAYSEDEADDFKEGRGASHAAPQAAPAPSNDRATSDDLRKTFIKSCRELIVYAKTEAELLEWWNGELRKKQFKDFDLSGDEASGLKQAVIDRRAALSGKARAA